MEEKEAEEVQENSEDEEVVYADQGLSIMVQWNLKAFCEKSEERFPYKVHITRQGLPNDYW